MGGPNPYVAFSQTVFTPGGAGRGIHSRLVPLGVEKNLGAEVEKGKGANSFTLPSLPRVYPPQDGPPISRGC